MPTSGWHNPTLSIKPPCEEYCWDPTELREEHISLSGAQREKGAYGGREWGRWCNNPLPANLRPPGMATEMAEGVQDLSKDGQHNRCPVTCRCIQGSLEIYQLRYTPTLLLYCAWAEFLCYSNSMGAATNMIYDAETHGVINIYYPLQYLYHFYCCVIPFLDGPD